MKLEISLIGIPDTENILREIGYLTTHQNFSPSKKYFFNIDSTDVMALEALLDKSSDNYYFRIAPKTTLSKSEFNQIKHFIAYPRYFILQDAVSFKMTDEYINRQTDNHFILDKLWLTNLKNEKNKIYSLDWAFEYITDGDFFQYLFFNKSGIERRNIYITETNYEIKDTYLIYIDKKFPKAIIDESWASSDGKFSNNKLMPNDIISIDYSDLNFSSNAYRTSECYIKNNYGSLVIFDRETTFDIMKTTKTLTFKPILCKKSNLYTEYMRLWKKANSIFEKYKSRKRLYFRQ